MIKLTRIKLKGTHKAVSEMAGKITKICKATKSEYKRGRVRRVTEMSIFINLNVYSVQELRKINHKNVRVEVI